MAWQDRYVQGSFRGVPFLTQGSRTTVGQRKAIYEHPFQDDGVTALPLGRRPRAYNLTAYVIGVDYDRTRDKLIEAFEKPGPGLLVHPYLGSVLVEIGADISINESTDQGGMAEITFDAREARGGSPSPNISTDTRSALTTKTNALRTAIAVAAERDLSLKDIRDFAAQANLKTLDNAIQDLRELNGTISTALAIPARFAHQIADVADQAVQLIQTPRLLVKTLSDAMALIMYSATRVGNALGDEVRPEDVTASALDAVRASSAALTAAVDGSTALGSDADPAVGANNYAQRRNHATIKHTFRALALSHVSDAAADATYDSAQRARDIRDALTEAIETESESIVSGIEHDANVLIALQDLRAAVHQHLSQLELASLMDYALVEASSSLTLAYELYGDASRADEIEARNISAHPGFLTGTLEVLSK